MGSVNELTCQFSLKSGLIREPAIHSETGLNLDL
jgi:hypothetical protein